MGQLVFILGRSGTGKSFSMRNFPNEKLAVVNVQGKIFPFRKSGQLLSINVDRSDEIVRAINSFANDGFKSIVVDDYQYLMANEFMRRSSERGYDKFTEIGRHAWDVANAVTELQNDVILYIMCHTDRDDEGNEKIKTIGKLLDEKICLEGMSTIVLKTNVVDGLYTFLTQNNGKDTVKSPAGMFPSYAIDNDLWYVDQKIRNYYGLGEFLSDEQLNGADDAVKRECVSTEDARRARRVRRGDSEYTEIIEKTENRTEQDAEAGWKLSDETEIPKRKRREVVQAAANTEKLETTTAQTEDGKPARRRRRRADDDDCPFSLSDD